MSSPAANVAKPFPWPLLSRDIHSNPFSCWQELKERDQQEYVEAAKAMASAEPYKDGYASAPRMFRLDIEECYEHATYVYWNSPNGDCYGLGFVDDYGLHALAVTDPTKALAELSNRFEILLSQEPDAPWPLEDALHALMIRREYVAKSVWPDLRVDPATRKIGIYNGDEHEVTMEDVTIPTDHDCPAPYASSKATPGGPEAPIHLTFGPRTMTVSLDDSLIWQFYSAEEVRQIASQANEVLARENLPQIPDDEIEEAAAQCPAYIVRRGVIGYP